MRPPERPGKVPLEKGYSQMDWIRLTRQHPNLAGMRTCPHICSPLRVADSAVCQCTCRARSAVRHAPGPCSTSCCGGLCSLPLGLHGARQEGKVFAPKVTYWQPPERPAGLGGAPLRRDITLKEVALHNSPEDAWLALSGKVHKSLDQKAPGELPVSDMQLYRCSRLLGWYATVCQAWHRFRRS